MGFIEGLLTHYRGYVKDGELIDALRADLADEQASHTATRERERQAQQRAAHLQRALDTELGKLISRPPVVRVATPSEFREMRYQERCELLEEEVKWYRNRHQRGFPFADYEDTTAAQAEHPSNGGKA